MTTKKFFHYTFSLLILCTMTTTASLAKQLPAYAVCIVPVANLFNEYLSNYFPEATSQEIERLYYNVHASNESTGLMRIHQLRFNDVVRVMATKGIESLVQCEEHFTLNNPNQKKVFNTYVILSKNLLFLDDIEFPNAQRKIPQPYQWHNKQSYEPTNTIFSLTLPYTDPDTEITYSIGTRFVATKDQPFENKTKVYQVVDEAHFTYLYIPKEYGVIDAPRTEAEKAQCITSLFVKYTHGLCTLNKTSEYKGQPEVVPTAFGGNSTTEFFTQKDFVNAELTLPNGTNVKGYNRPQRASSVQTGFTMPELNMTINQMCDVPFPYKNTTTFAALEDALQETDILEPLDYVSGPGYMGRLMKNNMIADIRSYRYHDGVARCVPLSQTFKGIETYDDLVHAYRTGQPLTLLNGDGTQVIATAKPGQWSLKKFRPTYNEKFDASGEFARRYR